MLVLNLLLALLGLTATLAAFGGETWRKGEEPLRQRITSRGWVSVFCLLAAFSLGIVKEVRSNAEQEQAARHSAQQQQKAARENQRVKAENQQLSQHIRGLKGQISSMQKALDSSTLKIGRSTARIESSTATVVRSNCEGLENAFKLAARIPRDYDDCVVHLLGRPREALLSRRSDNLELYWGDEFEYTFIPDDAYHGRLADLRSLKLLVGGRAYELHPDTARFYYSGHLRIYGSSPQPMSAVILNPKQLTGIGIKIFVRSTDATRGQQEFRRIVLNGQCSEFAKRVFKAVNTNVLKVRAQPSETAASRFYLAKGSFVRTSTRLASWVEIMTPENRQGWVKADYLATIE
jgi:FtsZ-binding cell division protein ZapB